MGNNNSNGSTGESTTSPVDVSYHLLDSLKHPACIIGSDNTIVYSNSSFKNLYDDRNIISLDITHPFFPEYRKNIAVAYSKARKGSERQCFAVMMSPDNIKMPVEIHLFPLFSKGSVTSILVLIKPVEDNRLTSFDKSTTSLVESDENRLVNSIMEFSPFPIVRINNQGTIINGSASLEGFFGYGLEELRENRNLLFRSVSLFDFERIRKAITEMFTGVSSFKRLGELKITTKNDKIKWANAIIYPVLVSKSVEAVDLIIEDITRVKELESRMSTLSRVQIVGDLTKGLLHSFNNMINVIMTRAQMLLQVTEKDFVIEGLNIIEKMAAETAKQIRRVQDFIGEGESLVDLEVKDLIEVIEDAIEFAKIHFKVETKEKRRHIKIERRYFCLVNIKADIRVLREIIVSMIFKVSAYLRQFGTINVLLRSNGSPVITVMVKKESTDFEPGTVSLAGVVFSEIDIRRIAEKLRIKIIEEESSSAYSIQAILPPGIIINKERREPEVMEYKLRDLDILLVEDEKALQEVLYELLDSMGNRLTLCENAEDALTEFKKGGIDIVITDYGTKGMTGLELTARVKEIDEKVITVLMSGWMISDLKAYKNVVDLFIPKPFQLENLIKEIVKKVRSRSK